jgi:hypothetical protein
VTDNALEGTNYHVKGPDGTYRDRLGVLQFCKELEDGFIKRWSTDRNPMVNYPDGREEPNLTHSSPNRKAKNTTKTPTTSTTTTAASKSKTTKKVATKKVTTSKETPTPANIKTRANSKQGAKGSGFVPRK